MTLSLAAKAAFAWLKDPVAYIRIADGKFAELLKY